MKRIQDVSPARRRNMQANRSRDTGPELLVRQMLHAAGYRYRLHSKDLPGKPDVTFASKKVVVEIRGCFWHGHGCTLSGTPATRRDHWVAKIAATKARDTRNAVALAAAGWTVAEVWECELRADAGAVLTRLKSLLGPTRNGGTPAQRSRGCRPETDGWD